METIYLDRLEEDTKQLVFLIESHTGLQIRVREEADRTKLAYDPDPANPTILIPPNRFPDASVMHELLHIKRFEVEAIPKIVVCEDFNCGPSFETNVAKLDNNIEHLFIVPIELELRPNRKAYWIERSKLAIDTVKSSDLSIQAQASDVLTYWVFTNHVLAGENVSFEVDELVKESGLKEIASNLFQIIQNDSSTKEEFSRALISNLDLPNNSVCFTYNDREEKV